MEAVVRKSESHQDRGNAEMPGEVADNRNGATGTCEYRWFAEHFTESLGGHLYCREVGIYHDRRTTAEHTHLRPDAGRCICSHKLAECGDHFFRILIWDQPEAYLGCGLCRNHRLCARACESAGNAVNFHRASRPHAFEY